MSNSEKVTIVLKSIKCIATSDGKNFNDEIYIKYTADGGREVRFPADGSYSIDPKNDNPWNINLPITYSNNVVISLFDSETGRDQFINSQTYYVADASQTEVRPINNDSNGGQYEFSTSPE
jgi:hypothetical protein